jgi:hypothetical protein
MTLALAAGLVGLIFAGISALKGRWWIVFVFFIPIFPIITACMTATQGSWWERRVYSDARRAELDRVRGSTATEARAKGHVDWECPECGMLFDAEAGPAHLASAHGK